MTNHQHTTRGLHTAPDSGKDDKGSMQPNRIQFRGKVTSKHGVREQSECDVYSAEGPRKL